MTQDEIECCRKIGRDEKDNTSVIGLPELDALCDAALLGVTERRGIRSHEGKKYLRKIISVVDRTQSIEIDVYSVLVAFNVTCPATAHCVKKLLCAGQRGKGSLKEDLVGATAALNRAIELAGD